MELPETCLTNVFKIDNLSEISYSVYRISSTFGSSPAWRVLSKAETNLRRRGKCVTTCPESSELWLFQIDNHGTDIAFTSDSGYNSYDGSGASEKGWEPMVWGLEEKTKEVLNTHEIFENLRPTSAEKPEDIFQLQALSQTDPLISPGTQLDPIDLSGTHRDVYILQQLSKRGGSNLSMSAVGSPASGSRHGSSTAGTPHPTTTRSISKQELVGQKLLLAMMSLLSYRLASSFSWLPLNLCTFLPKLDDEVDEESEILSYSPVSHGPALLTTISLSLSDDGSLHVTPKTISQSALQRLSNTNLPDTAESDVWLAPGGIIGRYMPKSNSDGLSHATPEWKAFVVKSLADRGIEMGQPNSIKWAHISIWSDIEGLIEIFWPTPLIFVRKYGGSETFPETTPLPGIVNVKSNTNTDEMNDLATQLTWYNAGNSLEFAEAWLSESASRDVEKKRRLEARSKTIPAMDIDRKIPLVAPTTDRSGTVYPTPPDGPSGNDSHPTPGGPTTAPTPGQTKVVEEPTPVVEPPTAPPTAEATVNGAEMDLDDNWMKGDTSKVNDDIFGGQGAEMGDDLFIDITEDDFGFFDKIGDEDFTDVGLEKTQIPTDAQPRPTTSHLSENMNDLNLGFSAIGYADDKLLDDMDLDLDDIGAAMDMQAEMQKDPISTQTGSDQSLSQPNGQGHKSVRLETQSADDIQPTIVQVETPPLSPQRAMKLLLLDPQSPRGTPPLPKGQLVLPLSRRKSLYSPVGFPSFIGRSDEKYMLGGRFFCAEDESSPQKNTSEDRRFSATFPRVKKFRNSRRPLSRDIMFLEDDEERSDLVPDIGSSDEESSSTDEYESGDEEMFEVPNEGTQDNSSYSESPEGIRQGLKRKRIPSERDYWGGGNKAHGVEVLNRSDKLDGAPEWAAEMANLNDKDVDNLSSAQRTLCDFSPTDSPLDGVFKFVPDNDDISNRLSSQDFSHVVGLLQEQIVWNTYLISTFYPGSPSLGRISSVEFDANGINDQVEQNFRLRKHSMRNQDDVEDLLTDLFGGLTTRCSLETLVYGTIGRPKNSIYGVSPGLMDPHGLSTGLTPINRPKSASEPNTGPSLLFKIGAPHVHVHRNATLPNSAIELLPPALHFWDTFGLTPHSGSKDLLMASVFPTNAALGSAAKVYMESFSSTYENCRLGETLSVKTSQILDGLHGIGLQIQGKVQPLDEKVLLRNYCDGIARLGESLVEIEDELQNVVLFIVNPFDTPSSVLDICIAFHMLKKAYVAALNSTHRVFPNNIILQIVPMKNMAVHDGIAVQTHNQSIRSALEVYERCTLTVQDHHSQTFPQETYTPSVVLAKLPPKSIAFRVSSDPSPAILQENMCLHMAYAQSIDERWISVAWGDDCGDIKEVGNFCLGIPGTVVLRNFEDVCREIWAVTNKIISKKRVHWRISLVKVGTIDEDEVEFWTKLSHDCAVANTLTVFSSDPSPPLTFKCAVPSIMPQAFNGQAQLVGTPGATPQSSGVSPDQFGTSSSQGGALTPGDTPAPEIDNDMALVDFTDETWGALLLHPLNNSDSAITTRPALASGYLIKRSGPNETDEPAVLAVSLIRVGQRGPGMPTATAQQQSPAVSRSNEDLLRETLTQYRGLVTLAQHFGVTDMMKEVLPWHIAAVMKCRDVFSCVL